MSSWKSSAVAALLLSFNLAGSAHARDCVGTQGQQPKPNPSVISGTPSCPQDDGNIILASDGSYYTFQCCMHESAGSAFLNSVQTTGYDDCIQACANTDKCQAFRYVYADYNDETEGTCRMYTDGEFSTTKCGNTLHDWAYLTDPPIVDVKQDVRLACSTDCPDADGQLYTAKNKQVFHMDCQKRHGTAWFHKTSQNSLKDCINSCASHIGCQSVDFHQRTRQCYLGKHQGEPTVSSPGWASAHSLGCSGACDEDSCTTCTSNSGPATGPGTSTPPTQGQDQGQSGGATPSVPATPPPPPPPTEAKCMDDNNSVVEIDGTKYNIRCELQIRDKTIVGSGPAATFTDCLKMCNNNADCKSADFWDPNGSKDCYLFDSPDEPAYTSGTNWAAYVA